MSSNDSEFGSKQSPKFQLCLIGESLKENDLLMESIEKLALPVVQSSNGLEYINDDAEFTTIYILDEFEGEVYKSLLLAGQRILGPTAVIQYADKKEPLPNNTRPLYTESMKNLVISFSGYHGEERKNLKKVVKLIRHMGGSVPKDFNVDETTHLIAKNSTVGKQYPIAAALHKPIMTLQWVYEVWARRRDPTCNATSAEFMQYKRLPFVGCKIALLGYQTNKEQRMIEMLAKNGGEVVNPTDTSCTHIVVEDGHSVKASDYSPNVHLVKNEWFLASIHMEVKAEERIYLLENPSITSSSLIPVRGNEPENLPHQLARESLQETDFSTLNSESKKILDTAKLSISSLFLDATLSADLSVVVQRAMKLIENMKKKIQDLTRRDREKLKERVTVEELQKKLLEVNIAFENYKNQACVDCRNKIELMEDSTSIAKQLQVEASEKEEKAIKLNIESLTLENCYDVLIAADARADQECVEKVVEFMLQNRVPADKQKWTDFCAQQKGLALKVLHTWYVQHIASEDSSDVS